jgi:hypothetical protein
MTLSRLSIIFLAVVGCAKDPFYEGEPPTLADTPVEPTWELGNLGGKAFLPAGTTSVDQLEQNVVDALAQHQVTVTGDFAECVAPQVMFGGRHAFLLDVGDDGIDVLTPPGPVRGGLVDLQVACRGGAAVAQQVYDYVLGDGDPADEGTRRLEPLHANEFGSFIVYYQAEPYINWPDPVGYGWFTSARSERLSDYLGGTPDMIHTSVGDGDDDDSQQQGDDDSAGSGTGVALARLPAQIPAVEWENPEQGSRLSAGSDLWFFRRRNTSEATEPLTTYAKKRVSLTFPGRPDNHTDQNANNDAAWLVVPFETPDGVPTKRYLRLGQDTGAWCTADDSREGCGEGDDEALDDTRLPIDNTWAWATPDEVTLDEVLAYEDEVKEHFDYLTCMEGAASEAEELACAEDALVSLPSGRYQDVQVCKSFDEVDMFPWLLPVPYDGEAGFCVIIEILPELDIVEGQNWVDVPEYATGRWALNVDNSYYDGFTTVGENVFQRNEPVFLAWPGAFSEGFEIPAKNWDAERGAPDRIPDELPEPGSEEFDEFPYLRTPDIQIDSFLGNDSDFATKFGFPALVPTDGSTDWVFPIPSDLDGEGWDDTYVVVTLEVNDIVTANPFGGGGVWRATAWAWADEEQVVIPAATLATLPHVADLFKPDSENQQGGDLAGFVSMEVHRIAAVGLGSGFRQPGAEVVFDVKTITSYYFHTESSCYDGLDNDGDGLCDTGECLDADGEPMPADPSCPAEGDGSCDDCLDNDNDGLVDWDGCPGAENAEPDSDCEDYLGSYETGECQDGEDNDGDGLSDLADPDCEDPATDPSETSTCGDGIDNDGDGWTDTDDASCADPNGSSEGGLEYTTDCTDGIDDDGDMLIDAADPGCADGHDPDETGEGDTCNDGIDNNEDGWTDLDDITCWPGLDTNDDGIAEVTGEVNYTISAAEPFPCSNKALIDGEGVPKDDDDADDLANAADPGCLFGADPSEEDDEPIGCEDRIDNDGDGWVDDLDPGCYLHSNGEAGATPTDGTCNDGDDNDNDGWTDAQDPDCASGEEDELLAVTPLQCNDGVDNDGDGLEDAADPDCVSGKDNHEEP